MISSEIVPVGLSLVKELRKISMKTFEQTFGEYNTPENMEKYLNENLSIDKLKGEINNPKSQFFFIKNEGNIAGYLKVNVEEAQSEKMGNDTLEVERIYVDNNFQRKGLGKILMDKAFEIAREKKKKEIWLGVWEKNYKALAFYKKVGFAKTGQHVFELGDDPQTDYIYTYKL